MGATAGPSNHRPGAGIDHVSPPSTPTASHLVCNELFPDDDDPFIYDGGGLFIPSSIGY